MKFVEIEKIDKTTTTFIYYEPILGVAQIILLLIKLFNVIKWSWPVVLIPLWVFIFIKIVFFIAYLVQKKQDHNG